MRRLICCAVCQLIAVSVFDLRSVCGRDLQNESAYTSNRIEGQTGIYLHTRDGERFVSAAFTVAEAPGWSPDGRKIAFQAKVDERWDIYLMDLDSRKHHQLTDDPQGDFHPVWSPDCTTVIFYHLPDFTGTSTPQLIYVSVDGTGETVIDVGKSGGYFPDVRSQSRTKW